ncbi:MAG: PAC2 family protein [Anaerolineae bacterium]|nr:PAC2 family protein [Anaerolineae bacterium]
MDERFELRERPIAQQTYMIAGWEQWADAGEISSALPRYVIKLTGAHKIGEIVDRGYYLYQIPGTHHLLRPRIKLVDGHRKWLRSRENEIYYAGTAEKGLVILRGEEPHRNAARYVDAVLDVAQTLGVRRIAVVAGVYGAVPYDRDRQVSCVYSLPRIKPDLARFALSLSNYRGGASIGTWLAHRAEERDIELVALYGMVPFYDLTDLAAEFAGIKIERDLKAWYDLLLRLNHMLELGLDLSELRAQADALIEWVDAQIAELERDSPELAVRNYIEKLTSDFEEQPYLPFGDVWQRELRGLFDE